MVFANKDVVPQQITLTGEISTSLGGGNELRKKIIARTAAGAIVDCTDATGAVFLAVVPAGINANPKTVPCALVDNDATGATILVEGADLVDLVQGSGGALRFDYVAHLFDGINYLIVAKGTLVIFQTA